MITDKSVFWIVSLSTLLLMGCSNNDDQRNFEDQAFTAPDNITETNSSGKITGQTDPDDWQVSPMYRSQISITSELSDPPHPNPLPFNSTLNLQIKFNVSEPVNAIEIRKFRLPSNSRTTLLRLLDQRELIDFNSIPIEGKNIAKGAGAAGTGLYRLLIYDGNQNLISYGDIRIK